MLLLSIDVVLVLHLSVVGSRISVGLGNVPAGPMAHLPRIEFQKPAVRRRHSSSPMTMAVPSPSTGTPRPRLTRRGAALLTAGTLLLARGGSGAASAHVSSAASAAVPAHVAAARAARAGATQDPDAFVGRRRNARHNNNSRRMKKVVEEIEEAAEEVVDEVKEVAEEAEDYVLEALGEEEEDEPEPTLQPTAEPEGLEELEEEEGKLRPESATEKHASTKHQKKDNFKDVAAGPHVGPGDEESDSEPTLQPTAEPEGLEELEDEEGKLRPESAIEKHASTKHQKKDNFKDTPNGPKVGPGGEGAEPTLQPTAEPEGLEDGRLRPESAVAMHASTKHPKKENFKDTPNGPKVGPGEQPWEETTEVEEEAEQLAKELSQEQEEFEEEEGLVSPPTPEPTIKYVPIPEEEVEEWEKEPSEAEIAQGVAVEEEESTPHENTGDYGGLDIEGGDDDEPTETAEYPPGDLAMAEEAIEYKAEEMAAKKVGGWAVVIAIFGMIFTAWQVSENPDGVIASVCRLSITIVGCVLKVLLLPCKFLCGKAAAGGHHPISSAPDYREPYRGRGGMMEMA